MDVSELKHYDMRGVSTDDFYMIPKKSREEDRLFQSETVWGKYECM